VVLQERFPSRVEGAKIDPDPVKRFGIVTAVFILIRVEAVKGCLDNIPLPPVSLDSEVSWFQRLDLLRERRCDSTTHQSDKGIFH
jgi:hypothetical protein